MVPSHAEGTYRGQHEAKRTMRPPKFAPDQLMTDRQGFGTYAERRVLFLSGVLDRLARRSAYVSYLETQLERVTASCMSVQVRPFVPCGGLRLAGIPHVLAAPHPGGR